MSKEDVIHLVNCYLKLEDRKSVWGIILKTRLLSIPDSILKDIYGIKSL